VETIDNGPRLLLVDDEEGFRDSLARRLELRGLHPVQAADGESCLQALDNEPVDVIVLDVKMPDMSGLDILPRVREDHPDTEVILLTGFANTADGVAGIKAGAFDYLAKPIEIDHLVGKIQQAMDKIRRQREKRKEKEFRERMEARMVVAERLASLGAVAGGVAHEINNPLAIINDAAGWLQDVVKQHQPDPPLDKLLAKGLEKITKSVERARLITHQLLLHARGTEPTLAETDMEALAEEARQLMDKEARNKDITISVQATGDATVTTDPHQLRQVLINLISNAIHASEENGQIDIAINGQEELVEISVQDYGVGIPQENLPRLLEPFFSTKAAGQGTGLGLFVTSVIVSRLGGTIDVESDEGKGANFIITLPREASSDDECSNLAGSMSDEMTCRISQALARNIK
jgi:signal transduction histidine kinase